MKSVLFIMCSFPEVNVFKNQFLSPSSPGSVPHKSRALDQLIKVKLLL